MKARDYPSVDDILAIHALLIRRFGGPAGLRDAGALEGALFRPQTGYYADIVAEAAALFESLAINHPFVDGNKRVAFATVDVFLKINSHRIVAAPLEVHAEMMRKFAFRTFDVAHLEPWLRRIAQASKR